MALFLNAYQNGLSNYVGGVPTETAGILTIGDKTSTGNGQSLPKTQNTTPVNPPNGVGGNQPRNVPPTGLGGLLGGS